MSVTKTEFREASKLVADSKDYKWDLVKSYCDAQDQETKQIIEKALMRIHSKYWGEKDYDTLARMGLPEAILVKWVEGREYTDVRSVASLLLERNDLPEAVMMKAIEVCEREGGWALNQFVFDLLKREKDLPEIVTINVLRLCGKGGESERISDFLKRAGKSFIFRGKSLKVKKAAKKALKEATGPVHDTSKCVHIVSKYVEQTNANQKNASLGAGGDTSARSPLGGGAMHPYMPVFRKIGSNNGPFNRGFFGITRTSKLHRNNRIGLKI